MIRNSVVAKLWLTIVGMVFVIQALLSVLLQQVFNKYIVEREIETLTQLATSIQSVLTSNSNRNVKERVASDIAHNVERADIKYAIPYTQNPMLLQAYRSLTPSQESQFNAGEW
ncbi:hypothetical protein GCM10025858_02870 [Alicyclobacillus sacchari]|uniref:hypothetical protein n=1 Tax=Alicyclobacillus sacchari TaxID=392010 RepID=UPI0023E99B7A|nr:hypothetical protein [Alicyclobacillus sacchari]GMA55784.1 hypothetical protein GCM10025858_02870 [Alicyclobacillus sacchari]